MMLYFACSLTGGRRDQRIYAQIVEHLLAAGHEVPTAHLAGPRAMHLEDLAEPAEVYQRDIHWIQSSAGLIAEVSTPSHGVGYEISYALGLSKPVLCLYQAGKPVSKMILGNDSPSLEVRAYQHPREALQLVSAFVSRLSG